MNCVHSANRSRGSGGVHWTDDWSGYRTMAEFDAAVGAKYQQLVDQGYADTMGLVGRGLVKNDPIVIGSRVDSIARTGMRDWLQTVEGSPDNQWTLDLAFEGLRLGLTMAVEEKGERVELTCGRALVEEAYAAYRDGNVRDGFFKLEELQKLLKKVPSR